MTEAHFSRNELLLSDSSSLKPMKTHDGAVLWPQEAMRYFFTKCCFSLVGWTNRVEEKIQTCSVFLLSTSWQHSQWLFLPTEDSKLVSVQASTKMVLAINLQLGFA